MPKINLDSNKKIIIISGATASGKSSVAIEIAKIFNGAIINADALQIYRDLPILSAQPTHEQQSQINHYLYGIFSAQQKISVGIWLDFVADAINKILNSKKIPIVVGGTGMYISCLINGIAKIPIIAPETRAQASTLYEKIGHNEFLKKFGTEKIIDKQKLLRRAEVFLQTGKNIDDFHAQEKKNILGDFHKIHLNLNPSRDEIYQNCNARFEKMLQEGAIEEVKNFIEKCPDFYNFSIAKTLGFHEIASFLIGDIKKFEMIKLATQKTRNYAKRQLTWFRHQFDDIIFCENADQLKKITYNFLNKVL